MIPNRVQVTRTRDEWWRYTGDLVNAPGRMIACSGSMIGVDPALTSPNVVVGIVMEPGSKPIYLRPGEFVAAPPFTRIWVFNPMIRQYFGRDIDFGTMPEIVMLGMVSLLVGDPRGFVGWRRADILPSSPAQLLAIGKVYAAAGGPVTPITYQGGGGDEGVIVIPLGCRSLRVKILALNALDSPKALNPVADLGGTLRLWHRTPLAMNSGGTGFDPDRYNLIDPDAGGFTNSEGPTPHYWCEQGDLAQTIDVEHTVFEYPVGTGDLLAFTVANMAGTNVASLVATVEGM